MSGSTDPKGVLDRVPELEALLDADAKLKSLVARGDVHAAYYRLFWLNLLNRLPEHRDTVKALVGNRRLFADAMRSTPWMVTLNGFGARLYGTVDQDPASQVYITNHYVTAFFLPLFPLSSYLVRSNGTAYQFIAKVPLGVVSRLWQRLVALAIVSGIAIAAFSAFLASRHNTIHVVNALPVAVDVTFQGEKPLHVAAMGRSEITVGTGTKTVDVTGPDGARIDSGSVTVKSGVTDVYNVLGAALVIEYPVIYSENAQKSSDGPSPTFHCGDRFIQIDAVDFAFVQPPESIKLSSKGQSVTKHALDVLPDEDGTRCVDYFLGVKRVDEALDLMARLDPLVGSVGPIHEGAARMLARFGQLPRAIEIARRGVDQHEDSIENHRVYQDIVKDAGDAAAIAELVAEYRARQDRAPDSADAAYLLARMEDAPAAKGVFTALFARFPKHAFIANATAYELEIVGDFAGAERAYDALRGIDATFYDRMRLEAAEVMAAAGHASAALPIVEAGFSNDPTAPIQDQLRVAQTYARIARIAGAPAQPSRLYDRIINAKKGSWGPAGASIFVASRMLAGWDTALPSATITSRDWKLDGTSLPGMTGADRLRLELAQSVKTDPAGALALVDKADDSVIPILGPSGWALLYCEAVRVAASGAAAEKLAVIQPAFARKLAAYIQSGDEALLGDVPTTMRAAAHLVRARVNGTDKDALQATARKEDYVHTLVTAAITTWPKAE